MERWRRKFIDLRLSEQTPSTTVATGKTLGWRLLQTFGCQKKRVRTRNKESVQEAGHQVPPRQKPRWPRDSQKLVLEDCQRIRNSVRWVEAPNLRPARRRGCSIARAARWSGRRTAVPRHEFRWHLLELFRRWQRTRRWFPFPLLARRRWSSTTLPLVAAVARSYSIFVRDHGCDSARPEQGVPVLS